MSRKWSVLTAGVLFVGSGAVWGVEFKDQIAGDAISGWEIRNGPPDSWSVKDGVLHCHGAEKWGGWLGTVRNYTDFIIELEYKLSPGGNSGVFLRTPREGHPSAVSFEIQILDNTAEKHKNLKPAQYCGSIYKIVAADKDATKPVGEWNRMRIMAEADHIVVWLNGEKVVDATGKSDPEILQRSREGAIGLQNHRSEVSFRNIRIADLAEDRARRTKWWREARFGMFIHWGPVSLKGTEIGWSRGGQRRGHGEGRGEIPVEVYDNLYKEFNPTRFDARQWVQIARDAGMKYMVFTTKHHDGFCEFDSKLTDYKITHSPFKRDVVAELTAACHEAGMPIGFYYSPPDWHHPDYRTENHGRYVEYMHGQIRELLSNYGRIAIMWFDGLGGTSKDWKSTEMFEDIFRLQPDIIINNRAGLAADHDTPEQQIGKFQNNRLWESCITICRQWAWKPEDEMKSLKDCIRTLVRCAGGDGNLLFNVGPMPTGEIEPRQVERLREMGQWLSKYGESIYGTRGGPFKPGIWGASTHKDNRIYVHVFEWPADGQSLALPPIGKKVLGAAVLTGGAAEVKQSSEGLVITMPASERQEVDTIIAIDLDGPAAEIAPLATRLGSLAAHKKSTASNVFQKSWLHGPEKAFDDDDSTRWATDAGTKQAWLEVDLGEPTTIGRAVISEAFDRVRAFELQYRDGQEWRTFARGSTIGADKLITFAPVTADRVRLNITEATEGPTIWEFQLFAPSK
ncbi:MAG TPA: alpha-L-fucosidase [Phycisphaerae bacterium]|nr:alpha-L-fucosidase [Phycisphaerae bacterium]HRR84204.1 alpha-L-fucosidase [Phycisphaerae bacterium]